MSGVLTFMGWGVPLNQYGGVADAGAGDEDGPQIGTDWIDDGCPQMSWMGADGNAILGGTPSPAWRRWHSQMEFWNERRGARRAPCHKTWNCSTIVGRVTLPGANEARTIPTGVELLKRD